MQDVSLRSLEGIEDACHQFETAWQTGERPVLESFVDDLDASQRDPLLGERLILELHYRRKAGELPVADEYHARFPDRLEHIRGVFARVAAERPAMAPKKPGPSVMRKASNA